MTSAPPTSSDDRPNAVDAAAMAAAGWQAPPAGGFTDATGPFWVRKVEGQWELGLPVEARHANGHIGSLHGGVLATFADVALGLAVAKAAGHSQMVTVQLQMHYVGAGRIGTLITCRPELVRLAKTMAFVRGVIMDGDRPIAMSDGVWKLLQAARERARD